MFSISISQYVHVFQLTCHGCKVPPHVTDDYLKSLNLSLRYGLYLFGILNDQHEIHFFSLNKF